MSSYVPTEHTRQYLVGRLAGYLDAVASVDGKFREYVASAALLEVGSDGIESVVRASLAGWYRQLTLVEFRQGDRWTEVEPFLKSLFLTQPFGETSIGQLPELLKRRSELAFQASDLIMFLARDYQPKGIVHLTMTNELAVAATGCVIEYEHDILLLVHVQWRSDA